MDLRTGLSLWQALDTTGVPDWSVLDRDTRCDALVIGAGITGALLADKLSERGVDTLVIDRRVPATGSTPASTALLQYEVDTSLEELSQRIGGAGAARAYELGIGAIDEIEALSARIECSFERRASLYLALKAADRDEMETELEARRAASLPVRFAEGPELKERWGLHGVCAIHSQIAAQVDPVQLTKGLLKRAAARGVPLRGVTDAGAIVDTGGRARVRTTNGPTIDARWVICATGYESARHLHERVVTFSSTYAFATHPLPPESGWADRALIWEHADPYLYARWSADHRLIIGGEDVPFQNPEARDALIDAKIRALMRKFERIAPGLAPHPAFASAGTFGSTKDGLGYIGAEAQRPSVLFALGFGGNGITYSVVARDIILSHMLGTPHRDAHLFRFGR